MNNAAQERRTQKPECPEHSLAFRARQNDFIICCAYLCNWKVPARRDADKEILTLGDIRKEGR